ncbi:MAG: thioredoxin family protein [Muribaculaceae bacterium]|jgi:thioredoxin 1|nr:thioredoxin family protein [Muribaculaceae bacterium]ROS85255.1 thioredoxin [Muribaculaceae bacterium Isolate-036 (Harlan)]RXE67091.1 thioredoxin [Muribaculaceae bacterium Isolate-001 (NCI)]MCX4280456.1 thioredoxin family protein [Muribaculaceae bacterium]GFI38341.1 thioredoxin-like protein [Muribaculaceae bacterium]
MRYSRIFYIVSIVVVLAGCGKNKNYRTPSELQSYETVSDTVKVESGTNDVRNGDTGAENAAVSNQESVVLHQMVSNGKPSIVDFTASWCGPCQRMKPIFYSLADDFKDEYNFISIDIDENPELANKYQVQAVPTFVFLDADGNEGNRITGMISKEEFRDELLHPVWY